MIDASTIDAGSASKRWHLGFIERFAQERMTEPREGISIFLRKICHDRTNESRIVQLSKSFLTRSLGREEETHDVRGSEKAHFRKREQDA
jgi:hypothetical protein